MIVIQINGEKIALLRFCKYKKDAVECKYITYEILTFDKSRRFSGVKDNKFSVYLDGVVAK